MNSKNPGDEIHIMPKAEGGVSKPTEPVKSVAPPTPTAPAAGGPTPTEPTAVTPKGTKSWTKIVLGIFLVALVAASVYFLYSAYKPSEPEPVLPAEEAEEEAVATEEVTLPVFIPEEEEVATEEAAVETEEEQIETATEDVIPEIVPGSREEFDYGTFSQLELEMISSTDTDEDDLTDREESLFNTESNNFDTDGDNFSDGSEVVNLYDPLNMESALLKDSDSIDTYSNENYKYTVLYPASWLVRGTDMSELEVVFTSENNEFVSVWVEENPQELELKDWYQAQAPNVDPQDLVEFRNKQGIVGLKSPDGFTVYFTRDEFVYIMHYNIGLKTEADYPSVYKMMIESFNLILNQRG